jgi:hypothetical protein
MVFAFKTLIVTVLVLLSFLDFYVHCCLFEFFNRDKIDYIYNSKPNDVCGDFWVSSRANNPFVAPMFEEKLKKLSLIL